MNLVRVARGALLMATLTFAGTAWGTSLAVDLFETGSGLIPAFANPGVITLPVDLSVGWSAAGTTLTFNPHLLLSHNWGNFPVNTWFQVSPSLFSGGLYLELSGRVGVVHTQGVTQRGSLAENAYTDPFFGATTAVGWAF